MHDSRRNYMEAFANSGKTTVIDLDFQKDRVRPPPKKVKGEGDVFREVGIFAADGFSADARVP